MKVRDCEKCKKAIAKEQEKACMSCQYDMFSKTADDIGKSMAAAMIAVLDRRKRTPDYIRKFFDDLIFILEYPDIFGKEQLHAESMKEHFEKKYGIDFDRIKIKVETKEECFRRYKIR